VELDYAFLADAANLSSDQKLNVLGMWVTRSASPRLPVTPILTFVARLIATPEECGKPHSFRLEILNPDGDRLAISSEQPFVVQPNPDDPGQPGYGAVVLGLVGATFPEYGNYRLRPVVNGQPLGGISLLIAKRGAREGDTVPAHLTTEREPTPPTGTSPGM
jgi:hypothetical protein